MVQIVQIQIVAIASAQRNGTDAARKAHLHERVVTACNALCNAGCLAVVQIRMCESKMGKEAIVIQILFALSLKYARMTSLIQARHQIRARCWCLISDAALERWQQFLKRMQLDLTVTAARANLDAAHFHTLSKQLVIWQRAIALAACTVAAPEQKS